MHRIKYSDGVDSIWVEVPWGFHTGQIPPPYIEFHVTTGGKRLFGYVCME